MNDGLTDSDRPCEPCAAYRRGEHDNIECCGMVVHACHREPGSWAVNGCECGCAERSPSALHQDKARCGYAFLGPLGERLDLTHGAPTAIVDDQHSLVHGSVAWEAAMLHAAEWARLGGDPGYLDRAFADLTGAAPDEHDAGYLYACDSCGETYREDCADALELEAAEAFTPEELHDSRIVCDDCWQALRAANPALDARYAEHGARRS